MSGVMTNCCGSKQEETRLLGSERDVRLDWKCWRQEIDVGRLASWKRELSLRFCARATPKRDKRVWQQRLVLVWYWDSKGWKLWQEEMFQGTV